MEVDDGYTIEHVFQTYERDRREWEVASPTDWLKTDPLLRALRERGVAPENAERAFHSLHFAWMKLPPPLRAQVFREREISSALVDYLPQLHDTIPGVVSVGVSLRAVRAPRLVGVVTVEQPLTSTELDDVRASWAERAMIRSRVTELAETAISAVPIIVEHRPAPVSLGKVLGGTFLYGDPDPAPPAAPVLQSGDQIGSESPAGIREFGTLACIVSRPGSTAPLALSSGHVLLRQGYDVISGRTTRVRVGTVKTVASTSDCAIAELDAPFVCDYRLKVTDLIPAGPVLPPANLPVQMHGAASQRQIGYLNQTNVVPAGASSVGLVPMFTADISCARGDSGALLVTGIDKRPPFSKRELGHLDPTYIENMTCAMLGMLKAGPPPDADPILRPQGYFIPILQILDDLDLEPWIR